MINIVKSNKGRLVDMNELFKKNQTSVAISNKNLNARGDLLEHGKIVKTVEERRQEYYKIKEVDTVTVANTEIGIDTASQLDNDTKELVLESLEDMVSTKKENKKPSKKTNLEESIINGVSVSIDDIGAGKVEDEEITFEE